MSYTNNIPVYLQMLRDVCQQRISAKDFIDQFQLLWEIDRDEDWKTRNEASQKQEYDDESFFDVYCGSITKKEFFRKFSRLWGQTEDILFIHGILDRIYTACECHDLWLVPALRNEAAAIDKKTFFGELTEHLHNLENTDYVKICHRPETLSSDVR